MTHMTLNDNMMLHNLRYYAGTASIMAWLHSRGELQLGESFTHVSVLGTEFRGRLLAEGVPIAGTAANKLREGCPSLMMTFVSASQFHVFLLIAWVNAHLP